MRNFSIAISTTISKELYEKAKQNNISWAEALRTGMSMLLADLGEGEYDNNLNLFRKMRKFQTEAQEALQKLTEIKDRIEKEKNI
jgi:hypothetical protein